MNVTLLPNLETLAAHLGMGPETEEDRELERQIDVTADLLIAAESEEEAECVTDALARLVNQRSDRAHLRSEVERRERKIK